MVYLYAALGMVMLSGIMAIFEMGLSLTGQSMIPTPPDEYFSDTSKKTLDIKILKDLGDATFPGLVLNNGLCSALEEVNPGGWTLISKGRWANNCQLNLPSYRIIVKEDPDNYQMPYQLFSCDLGGKNIWFDEELGVYRCFFERE